MSVFRAIRHGSTSEEAAHQIEALVLEGVLRSGDQLPAERNLAIEMGVSRPVLRQAIETLVGRGILQRRHGDGTFVNDIIGQVFSDPIAELLPHHRKATIDYLEYRREIEGTAAGFAARRATAQDRAMLQTMMERMRAAHERGDFREEAQADLEFHLLIGEMAHNLVMLHTLRSCYRLLSEGIFRNRDRLYETEGGRHKLLEQHFAIGEAILAGREETARQAARDHITYILDQYSELEQAMERERISDLRLRQRGA